MDTTMDCSESERNTKKRFFVMRHGERIDFAFGRSWLNSCFDDKGNYTRRDLNMPLTMVKRESHFDFQKDSPLTEIGHLQATATGKAMKMAGVNIKYVYVSPALRSVQTAQGVLNGLENSNLRLRIEPIAFEWLGWYKNGLPMWLSPKQLAEAGFSIDTDHKPFSSIAEMNKDEDVSQYYSRCHQLTEFILEKHKHDDGDILIVAHAGSLDCFTRQLVGKPPRDSQEMHNILASFSYCCLCSCVEEKPKSWKLKAPPIPPIHGFDWKVML